MAKRKPPQNVDVEAIKRRAIVAMFSHDLLFERLTLKGGNALQLVYGLGRRSSFDLDFSIDGDFADFDEIQHIITGVLDSSFGEIGLRVFDIKIEGRPPEISEELQEFWGGYEIRFKLISFSDAEQIGSNREELRRRALPLGPTGSTQYSIDLSRHEYCGDRRRYKLDDFTIYVYSLEQIVGEKLRAICQQMPEYGPIVRRQRPGAGRARDFIDIASILQQRQISVPSVEFSELVVKLFQAKRVPLSLLSRIEEQREVHRVDFVSVLTSIPPEDRPGVDYDDCFNRVVEICRSLEPLWDV